MSVTNNPITLVRAGWREVDVGTDPWIKLFSTFAIIGLMTGIIWGVTDGFRSIEAQGSVLVTSGLCGICVLGYLGYKGREAEKRKLIPPPPKEFELNDVASEGHQTPAEIPEEVICDLDFPDNEALLPPDDESHRYL